jgi:rare lipoprotein A
MHGSRHVALATLFALVISGALAGGARAETVTATWYGKGFCGGKTASGERYNCRALTAAHPRLPYGSRVLVRNTRNQRAVVLRINDRGPAKRTGHGLDVSPAGRDALGMGGVAPVQITVLGRQ